MNNLNYFGVLLVYWCSISHSLSAQKINLSPELNEISGLTWCQDRLIAITDGGNEPMLFFLDSTGKIIHRCQITNAVNVDWESITSDSNGNLYIADCGNNLNARKELQVYKVDVQLAFTSAALNAESCSATIPYPELPLSSNQRDFDFEAMNWEEGKLVFYSKSRAKPWHGKTFIYQLEWKAGTSVLVPVDEVFVGKGGWMNDAVTASCSLGNSVILLTYRKIVEVKNGRITLLKRFFAWRQREGIAVDDQQVVYVVSERSIFQRHPKLEKVHLK